MTENSARHDPNEVIGECPECFGDVTRGNRVEAHSYRATFCSDKCWQDHKSKRGDRFR